VSVEADRAPAGGPADATAAPGLAPGVPSVVIDFVAADPQGAAPLRAAFGTPLRVLQATRLEQVGEVLAAVEAESTAGRWCAGYVAYEAAPAFDPAFVVHPADGPLAWFGVFDSPLQWSSAFERHDPAQAARLEPPAPLNRDRFDADVSRIHADIAAGTYYQVNHTTRLEGDWLGGTPWALFQALRRAQPGGYAAYLDTGAAQVLSVSPELFFDWDGQRVLTRPMKGTAARGATPEQDAAQAQALRASTKEQAENVMIVDLLRNDLSRIAQPHSVQVPQLFALQALPTVWQMTSDVTAIARPGTGLVDLFTVLFPCGSVTGAPKVQAMRAIRALEPDARGVYCGAIGVVRPGGAATFNVAIRTVTVRDGRWRCGIGSGVTADATADGEWAEWHHKQGFLERAREPFQLLETLALENGHLRHRTLHLARLARAASHFGYSWDATRIEGALDALEQAHPQGLWRVRLLLNVQGQPEAQAFAMESSPASVTLALAQQPFAAAHSEFVRYKTTRRAHYDAAAPSQAGVFDVILWNAAGELTECTRGNLAVCLDGQWLTPPLSSGLLDGVGRQVALQEGRLREAVLRVEDLQRASGLAFVNSLRGWIPATLAG